MRIGIEGQRLWRSKKHGMDFVALELIKKLQSIDLKNEYFVFIKSDTDRCLEETQNFHLVELSFGTYPVWEQITLPLAVKKYKIELLHCTSNTAPLFLKIPFIVTVHDVIYLENFSLFNKGGTLYQRFGNYYRRWIVPRVIKRSLAVTTVSDYEKKTIDQLFPDYASKIFTIHNGVGEHFKPVTSGPELERIRKKYNLPGSYIFYQGNTDPKKNTRNVLMAYAKYHLATHDPMKLLLIDFSRPNLVKILESIGFPDIIDDIYITGYIINSDLPAVYSLSKLFLYPSIRESFGIPLLEAMGCGTPVLTSNTSSMPEIAGNAACYTDPGDPSRMAEMISGLLSDPAKIKDMVRKGFERSCQFSWTQTAIEMMNLYNKLMP